MIKHYPALKRTFQLLIVSILLSTMFMSVPPQPAQAGTFTVTNTNDSGAGSLRQAIADADDGDTITFSATLSGQTISLSSQIEIEDDLSIDGSDLEYPVAVITSTNVRVFLIDSLATATINQIVMGNSYSTDGGIIINHGDLTITNCTLAGGEAIYFGGAIYNTGTLTVSGSTIFGNLAGSYGGAIYAESGSTTSITNSTIYDNSGEYGGGLYTNLSATSTVIHSTLAENTATYGGSAVHTAGSLTLINSILDSNTGGTAECVWTGSMTAGQNVISDGSCAATYTSAYLGPLADNGGPTQTMAIGYLSAARNTGDGVYCETTDQRGVARGAACDIGAYEYATSLTVDSTADPGDGVCDTTECTLRDAVATIETNGVIDFDPSLAGDTITLGSEIEISGGLIIDASALSPGIQISGGDAVRVFHILSSADVELDSLDIIHGGGVFFGGGIYNEGTLELYTSTLFDNNATNVGGGIYNSGTLTVSDSTFSNNNAQGPVIGNGAGIYNTYVLTVSGSTFTGNTAYYGGGIYDASVSTTTISNSTFYDNSADPNGGGIYNSGGTLTVHNSTFSDNIITGSGGGIHNSLGTMYLENSILANTSGGNDCYSSNTSGTRIDNLIESGTCGSALSSDPLLGPLMDNGGSTETMALGTGSPAIDAGDNPTCEATDQRGWSRPIDGDLDGTADCDIGAFERTIDLFMPLIMR